MRNSLTLLNETGDTTISWDESNDDKMEALIEKKMKEGMTFFIIKNRFFGLVPMKVKVKTPNDLTERFVILKDEDFNGMIANGSVKAYKRQSGADMQAVSVMTDAKEASTNHVVGINQRKGG